MKRVKFRRSLFSFVFLRIFCGGSRKFRFSSGALDFVEVLIVNGIEFDKLKVNTRFLAALSSSGEPDFCLESSKTSQNSREIHISKNSEK